VANVATCGDGSFAKLKVAGGYANFYLPYNDISVIGRPYAAVLNGYGTLHHSGGFVDVEWNPTQWLSLENYAGIYSVANHITLFVDIPGSKIILRKLLNGRVAPYAVGGFGFGLFSERASSLAPVRGTYYHHASPATRYGSGTDVQINNRFGLRLDVSRMTVKLTDWATNWNLAGGVILRLTDN